MVDFASPFQRRPQATNLDRTLQRIERDLSTYRDQQAQDGLEQLLAEMDPVACTSLQRWFAAARAILRGVESGPEVRRAYQLARADMIAGQWGRAGARLALIGEPNWQPAVTQLRAGMHAEQSRLAEDDFAPRRRFPSLRAEDRGLLLFMGSMLLAGLGAILLVGAGLAVSPSAPAPIAADPAVVLLVETALPAARPSFPRGASASAAADALAIANAAAEEARQDIAQRIAAVAAHRARGAWPEAIAEAEEAVARRPESGELHALRNETIRQATQVARGTPVPRPANEAPAAEASESPVLDSNARLTAAVTDLVGDALREASVENGRGRVVYKQNRGWSDGVTLLASASRFRDVAVRALEVPEVERLELTVLQDRSGRPPGEEVILNLHITRAAAARVGLRVADTRTLPRRLNGPGIGFFVYPTLLGVWTPLMPPA